MFFEEVIKQAYDMGFRDILECRPFFLPEIYRELTKRVLGETDMMLLDKEKSKGSGILDNPLPFKVCCFETANGFATPVDPETKQEYSYDIVALAAIERDPLNWDIFMLVRGKMGGKNKLKLMHVNEVSTEGADETWFKALGAAIQGILHFLKETSRVALESKRMKIKVGKKKTREYAKIMGVVHVYGKTERAPTLVPVVGGTIDYSHRFEVRGHWRRVEGVGKNREGLYSVAGFTWISPFIKGNESLPFIKKTRVVHNDSGAALK